MKVTSTCVTKFHAIAHLIGEYERLENKPVDTVKIAVWLGVSKPTAIKYLNLLQSYGYIRLVSRKWRKNAYAYAWILTEKSRNAYTSGAYESHYRFYHALMLQALSNPKRGTVSI